MHAAIVETDPETAEITILRYCVVHDCGTLINPMIVEGQVHGGVAQGVGGALYERMAYDEAGQLLNASFMDFLMPYASEVPLIETDHLETPSPLNPLGIKGAGEAGVHPGHGRHRRRPSRTPRASRSPGCRSRPTSCGTSGAVTPRASSPTCAADRVAAAPLPAVSRRNSPMKVSGIRRPQRPREQVWAAFNDPAVLARTLPGCQELARGRARRVQDDVTAGCRLDQGHLRRRGRADRPAAAGSVHAARPPAPARPGTVERRRRGHAGRLRRRRHRT